MYRIEVHQCRYSLGAANEPTSWLASITVFARIEDDEVREKSGSALVLTEVQIRERREQEGRKEQPKQAAVRWKSEKHTCGNQMRQ